MNAANFITANFTDTVQESAAKAAPKINTRQSMDKVREAVRDFESFFISQMFQSMYDTVPVNVTFGGGHAETLFRSMLVDEYGKMAAKSGGVGISDAIMKQIIEQQASLTAL